MRRADREVTKMEDILDIVSSCKVCRVGMRDEEGLYILPLNFGYVYEQDRLTLYFHCAREGRKLDAIKADSNVCFEMDGEHGLIEGNTACEYGYSFKSVVGTGSAYIVTEMVEKKRALYLLMKHQSGKNFEFTDAMANSVAVFRIEVNKITGKYHP